MEISLLADTVTLPSIQTLAYTNSSNLTLQISASLCPPPVKSALKTLPRRQVRKKRRTRRISLTAGGEGGGYDDLEDGAEIPAGADAGGGDSGGSFRWGGGGRGNSDGLGWSENEESKDWPFGSAFHAFYEVHNLLDQESSTCKVVELVSQCIGFERLCMQR